MLSIHTAVACLFSSDALGERSKVAGVLTVQVSSRPGKILTPQCHHARVAELGALGDMLVDENLALKSKTVIIN